MPILHGLEQVLAPEDRIKQAFSRMLHVLSAQPNRQELLQHLEVELHCVIHMVHQALSRSETLATMAFDRLAGSIKAQVREVLRLLGLLIASDEASSVPPAWQLSVHESEQLVVGVMLSSFGLFWTGEGLGIDWPARDAAIVVFAAALLVLALGMSRLLARPTAEATR